MIIAKTGNLEPSGFPTADLSQAKQLAREPDDDIRGTVVYMLEVTTVRLTTHGRAATDCSSIA